MTERLYYYDAYLRDFTARIIDASADGTTVYLDRTGFYPTSGGQPYDTGTIAGNSVVEVVDEEERIAHRLTNPVAAGEVTCSIDWPRRFDHMQQHTGQHLLSAVFEERSGLHTISFHLGPESATIDLEGGPVDSRAIEEAERRSNEIVQENRAVQVLFQDAAEATDLRKPSARAGTLRIVSIEGLDRSACGGTHVRFTGEIGSILIRRLEKVRQSTRVEFVCGNRAVRRARADFNGLSQIAQLLSAPLDDTPALVRAQLDTARMADKARRKLELDLAIYQGKELYEATPPDSDGVRRHARRLASGSMESLRAVAESFTSHPGAIFAATVEEPPSILLAVSADTGIDAGKTLKNALASLGGRGGGTPRVAQGSVPDRLLLPGLLDQLSDRKNA